MSWMDDFLRRCLSGIPKGPYYKRLRSELTDHLTILTQALMESGRSQQDAQREALRQIGDPDLLNHSYQEAWLKQPERAHHDMLRLFQGCLVAGACYVMAIVILGICGLGYDGNRFPITGYPERCTLLGVVLFLSAFLAEAFFLRAVFHRRSNSRTLITVGLLIAWAGEKVTILLFSALIYGISPLSFPHLLQRIAHGGDQTAPWFTVPYIMGSLIGCLILGWVFGRKRTLTTA